MKIHGYYYKNSVVDLVVVGEEVEEKIIMVRGKKVTYLYYLEKNKKKKVRMKTKPYIDRYDVCETIFCFD